MRIIQLQMMLGIIICRIVIIMRVPELIFVLARAVVPPILFILLQIDTVPRNTAFLHTGQIG